MQVRLLVDSKLPICVNVSVNGCLSLYVGPSLVTPASRPFVRTTWLDDASVFISENLVLKEKCCFLLHFRLLIAVCYVGAQAVKKDDVASSLKNKANVTLNLHVVVRCYLPKVMSSASGLISLLSRSRLSPPLFTPVRSFLSVADQPYWAGASSLCFNKWNKMKPSVLRYCSKSAVIC